MEFAKALTDLKPYIETDQQKDFELMQLIDRLKNDGDQDVADAMENTDVILLQERKTLAPRFNALEVDNLRRETGLNDRWLKEEEERKRRQEEEEENKFDFSSFLLESKKPVTKKGTKQGIKGRGGGGSSSNNAKNGTLASRQ